MVFAFSSNGSADVGQLFAQGFALHQQGQLPQAQMLYAQVLKAEPGHFDALHLSGVIAHQTGDYVRAEQLIARSIKLNSGHADAWSNLGNALAKLDRTHEAIRAYDKALAMQPANPTALFNRGSAWSDLQQDERALADFDAAIAHAPGFAEAHNFRAAALAGLRRFAEAEAACDQALALMPDFPEALVNRSVARREMKRFTLAAADMERALLLKPDLSYCRSLIASDLTSICDWSRLEEGIAAVREGLADGGKANSVFHLLSWLDEPGTILQAGQAFFAREVLRVRAPLAAQHAAKPVRRAGKSARPGSGRIRIGYFSSDFGDHPVSHLLVEALELHDRDRFEIHGFSLQERSGAVRDRIVRACDRFHDLTALSDEDAAELVRRQRIDIAVDLNGHTGLRRPGIFARRPAPVQVNFLGYAASVGTGCMDYIIADPVVIPPDAEPYYAEKIVRLPGCYMPSDRQRTIAERPMRRSEWGLPEQGFVFCSFNNNYKIMPDVFACWMRLLHAVEGSVLWLRGDNPEGADNLKASAARHGIDPDRLVWAGFAEFPDHYARHRLADLFIDTFPYNAHTTANDALWAGLPVLTLAGKGFQARVAASLLHAAGLPELVTHSLEEYETRALELARDPVQLGGLTARLRANRDGSVLFDTPGWVAAAERAYAEMTRRAAAGLRPENITLDPGAG